MLVLFVVVGGVVVEVLVVPDATLVVRAEVVGGKEQSRKKAHDQGRVCLLEKEPLFKVRLRKAKPRLRKPSTRSKLQQIPEKVLQRVDCSKRKKRERKVIYLRRGKSEQR